MKDIGLTEQDIEEIRAYLHKIEAVESAIVYGSRAKGNYRDFSDVDLTLTGDGLTFSDLARLEDDLHYSYLPYTFDVSIFSRLNNPDLVDHIRRVGVEIYSRREYSTT